jgi:hypothetical protein
MSQPNEIPMSEAFLFGFVTLIEKEILLIAERCRICACKVRTVLLA